MILCVLIIHRDKIYLNLGLSDTILKKLNIPTKHYGSALKQRQPLGGSAIFLTGRYLTIEQATILAPMITAYENKPAKEKRKIMKEFVDGQKKVTIIAKAQFICKYEKKKK